MNTVIYTYPGQVHCLMKTEMNPKAWQLKVNFGRATRDAPVQIQIKDPASSPHWKRYSLRPEVKRGLLPVIDNLKAHGLLVYWNSPNNTPLLGIQKPNEALKLVQDLDW